MAKHIDEKPNAQIQEVSRIVVKIEVHGTGTLEYPGKEVAAAQSAVNPRHDPTPPRRMPFKSTDVPLVSEIQFELGADEFHLSHSRTGDLINWDGKQPTFKDGPHESQLVVSGKVEGVTSYGVRPLKSHFYKPLLDAWNSILPKAQQEQWIDYARNTDPEIGAAMDQYERGELDTGAVVPLLRTFVGKPHECCRAGHSGTTGRNPAKLCPGLSRNTSHRGTYPCGLESELQNSFGGAGARGNDGSDAQRFRAPCVCAA